MAISKKQPSALGGVPQKQVIKVNPYENPENVLELMSSICSAVPTTDSSIYWNYLYNAFLKEIHGKSLKDYIKEKRGNLLNYDFVHDLDEYCSNLSLALTSHENTEHTQIVVAGGFSSGKSSFLNRLTNCSNLLPTGVEPVSVVKTYLYCSRNNRNITVKGVNQKNILVNLNVGVLQAIQHAKKSNIYLASVLEKLFVEIPSNDLDGLVFIDTPGYNNSEKPNQSNGKTDKETALEAMKEGNVLFWLVDCERGTTVSEDIEIIKQFKGKKVFIFNKADKKGVSECEKIVEEAARTLSAVFPNEDIIDIIAYSTLENKIYYSKNKKNLSSIVSEARKSGNGVTELNSLKDLIGMLFDDEIAACQRELVKIKEEYDKFVELKREREKTYRDLKYNDDEYITCEVRQALVDNYNALLKAADRITSASLNSLEQFEEFLRTMYRWDNEEHECWSNTLTPKIDSAANKYEKCCDRHNSAINYSYYKEDYRRDLAERIRNFIADQFKERYDSVCQECENLLVRKTNEENMERIFSEYKRVFMEALDLGIKAYQKEYKAINVQKEDYIVPNVFECIVKDDYKRFLHSFEDGVDLMVCNVDGYNPLTLAVQTGNNMMVQFMLEHEADPSIKDKRGYNAFHTAVENQFRDICKLLLDYNPDLIYEKTASGETVETLANKQTFTKWIEQEIDNAL